MASHGVAWRRMASRGVASVLSRGVAWRRVASRVAGIAGLAGVAGRTSRAVA